MFIDKIMTEIWQPITKEYKEAYDNAMELTTDELYQRHTRTKMKYFPYIGVNMNYIDTLGCPYRMKGGRLSGCSMCDYQSEHTKMQGSLLALREKNPELYAKVVKIGFQNSRGVNVVGNVIENVSGYDSLDKKEVPEELCNELFKKDIFEENPFIYNIEARASSVTEERLIEFKKTVANKKRVSIDFGVEVSNEWLRNNWLNKDVTNQQIIDAVELLHKHGFKAVGNVLLGIPGLTEQQNIDQFVASVIWMDGIGIDKIVIHVLNRKKYTLHGYIYENIRNDKELLDVGLVQKEHTGIPWLFTIITALAAIYEKNPNLYTKTVMTRLDENFNSITNEISYNYTKQSPCNKEYKDYLNGLALNNLYSTLPEMVEKMRNDLCYSKYIELLEKQKKCGNISDTIKLLSRKIAQCAYSDQWEKMYEELYVPTNL